MTWWPTLRFFVAEARTSLTRQKGLTLSTASVLALALFVLGVVLVFITNAGSVIDSWKKAAPLTVFLAQGVENGERSIVEELLGQEPALESYRFVSRQEALAGLEEDLGTLTDLLTTLGSNPLPDAYVATLRPRAVTSEKLAHLAARLEELPGVDSVEYGASWMGRWQGALQVLEASLYCVGAALGGAVVFIVAQTLRLKIYARMQEIEIMELVGATRRFIHGPFVVEGAVQGMMGSLAAFVLLYVSFSVFRAKVVEALLADAAGWPVSFLSPGMSLLFLLAGRARVPGQSGVDALSRRGLTGHGV